MFRNTIRKAYPIIAVTLSVILVCLVIIASCGPYNSIGLRESPSGIRNNPPVDAFVVVSIDTTVEPEACDPLTKACEKIIKELPPIKSRKTGSGMKVWYEGKAFILTAEHVCSDDDEPTHFKYPEKDISIRLKIESRIQVTGVDGLAHDATIAGMNKEMDLCALHVKGFKGGSVSLSVSPPRVGDTVYSIAAPYGLGGESLSLVFEGRYSGFRRGMHYYTIPTRPGSSGAIVLNSSWQAIGSLHTAYVPLESIGMGAGWSDLKLFLESLSQH